MHRGRLRLVLRLKTRRGPKNVPEKLFPILRRRLGRGVEIREGRRRAPVHTFHLTRREVEEESADVVTAEVREDALRVTKKREISDVSSRERAYKVVFCV